MPVQPSNSTPNNLTVISFPSVPDERLGELRKVLDLIAGEPVRVYRATAADVQMLQLMDAWARGERGLPAESWVVTREAVARRWPAWPPVASEHHGDGGVEGAA